MKKSKVLTTGSIWTLLIYLIYVDLEEAKRTYYFFSNNVHFSIRRNFRHKKFSDFWDRHYRLSCLYYSIARFLYRIRYPFLLHCDIFGLDQGRDSQAVIGYNYYTLIEDGSADYLDRQPVKVCKKHRIMYGPLYGHEFGRNKYCRQVIITRNPTTLFLKEIGKEIDLRFLWKQASIEKKEFILSKFNITLNDVRLIQSRNCLVLTQPLSEGHLITETEKINIYKRYIAMYGEENVVIKTHPHEQTDYRKHFPHAVIFDKVAPMQLFSLLGVTFTDVATLGSTAAFLFVNTSTRIYFEGYSLYPSIKAAYGDVSRDLLTKLSGKG